MYVIAVCNEKGGVAKTTTVVSLAASLAETGNKVLTIDLDSQANLSLALGLEPEKIRASLTKTFYEFQPIKDLVCETAVSRLNIIPSNSEMGAVERFLPIRKDYEYALRQALMNISEDYDYVILDCPPFLGVLTLNAMVASNLLIIPTQAEFFSIFALRTLMGWVRRVRVQYNSGLLYRLLLTMYDRRNKSHRILSEQLHYTFNAGLMNTVIETDTKIRESSIVGLPIILYAPKSRAALQYRALSQEIVTYAHETVVQSP